MCCLESSEFILYIYITFITFAPGPPNRGSCGLSDRFHRTLPHLGTVRSPPLLDVPSVLLHRPPLRAALAPLAATDLIRSAKGLKPLGVESFKPHQNTAQTVLFSPRFIGGMPKRLLILPSLPLGGPSPNHLRGKEPHSSARDAGVLHPQRGRHSSIAASVRDGSEGREMTIPSEEGQKDVTQTLHGMVYLPTLGWFEGSM